MTSSLLLRSLLPFAASIGLVCANPSKIVDSRFLKVPSSPPAGRQIVDANYQSYSIEFSYMHDYAGNDTHPNEFSLRMLKNLEKISGAYPIMRIGGSTSNRAIYDANQKEAVIPTFDRPTDDQPSRLTIGPSWMESFHQWGKDIKYIYGLSFYDQNSSFIDGRDGIDETAIQAKVAYDSLGDQLYAFEIGNEMNLWQCTIDRPCDWTIDSYVSQWNDYANAVQAAIGNYENIFQGCVFTSLAGISYNTTPSWSVEDAVNAGMNSTKSKTIADHQYLGMSQMGCPGRGPVPTIEGNVLNRTQIHRLLYEHERIGNVTKDTGMKYVLGETNAIGCQGAPGISDVFAEALWSVDYILYLATLNIERVHFHMGTQYRYSPWQPIDYLNTTAQVKPLYYGNMMTSKIFAGGNKQVDLLLNETTLAAYTIYDAGEGRKRNCARPESVVVANMAMWNSTQLAHHRPYTKVQLPKEFKHGKVRRLTSPGVETSKHITFAGQWVDNKGYIRGREETEKLHGGSVLVGAGEAVLVSM
ncbi:family 79 glycoside hydrolase [Penicillium vulpinum]|uniref:Beta-glucuronidase C-terminal domain-containing protein n=1 Tax=Penicillium vulpinum TaxID=29845 RepID=A0A1V6SAN0_9EURO|nr:family 79 glycoside hydrolase [Penicillium vulpinum]KAJ5960282.1 family 79 glycoside hydrolase [Penicillium vulpinum]OQE11087.1 hypothetical protein PENVUL_c003G08581 [Penicillium vulpinum]